MAAKGSSVKLNRSFNNPTNRTVPAASKGISAKQVDLNRHRPPPRGWRDLKMANLSWADE